MPQTGAAGSGRSDHVTAAPRTALVSFNAGAPPTALVAIDSGAPPALVAIDSGAPPALAAFDPVGDIKVTDSRAATRAARAEQFAAHFGLDELGPSAEAIADRYDFRYEGADADPTLPAGRRTVTITGRGADRSIPPAERSLPRTRRPAPRRTELMGFRSDRAALWAVGLALLLAFLAATSAHAATLHTLASLH